MRRSVRKNTLAPAARACTNCQKRKSRCLHSGENGPCSFCEKTGKTCSFEGPPYRTPLTRRNLDTAEYRCTQLRSLLQSLNPDLNIEAALAEHTNESALEEHVDAFDSGHQFDKSDEATPDSYEWNEGSLSPTDGMATLSTTEAGYLGSSSGSRLLEEIDSSMTGTMKMQQRKGSRKFHQAGLARDPPGLSISYVTNNLIDAYFHLYHIHYPVLHEKTFRERVSSQHKASPPWRVTYYLVLAIGQFCSSNTESEYPDTSEFYAKARAGLSLQMLESGSVETVQAFLLLGNYLQKKDRTNTGYNYIGLAYRLALGIGLHREVACAQNTIGHERRRQLFWTMYCFESGFNITTGRPPTMTDGFIDISLPRNIYDKGLSLEFPVPEEVEYPTTYSAIIAQAKLARIADVIYHEYLSAKTAGSRIEYRLAELLERDLTSWRKSLPSYFTSTDCPPWFIGPRSVLRWKEQNLRILLWRGSQKYHSYLPTRFDAEEKSLDVAMESVHDIATFCMSYEDASYHLVWYATYCLIQATLVILVLFLGKGTEYQSNQELPLWHHSVFEARDCFRQLAKRSVSARRCLEMLDRICTRFESLPTLNLALDTQDHLLPNNASSEVQMPLFNDIAQQIPELMDPLSENNLVFGEDGQVAMNDDTGDDLRMFMNEVSIDFMGNIPLDLLFNDWVEYS